MPFAMPTSRPAAHILPTAATMAGVCVTVVGIIKLTELSRSVSTAIDDVLAMDSALFLLSSVLSYLSLRAAREGGRLEQVADILFLVGMTIMVICAFLLVYALDYF
jgi:hypothetical protein